MAQPPADQKIYRTRSQVHPQSPAKLQNSFNLLKPPEERIDATNFKCTRPKKYKKKSKSDDLSDSLVIRRNRRLRTTFTSVQIVQLEQHFLQGKYLTPVRLTKLSQVLDLGTPQVRNWFKNRRRRLKIQSEYDCNPLSPPATNCGKTETSESPRSCNSNSCDSPPVAVIPSAQCLSLSGSDGSRPNALTPSPTPKTPTSNFVEHYGQSAFNSYYYNNHHDHLAYASLAYPYAVYGTEYYQTPLMHPSLKNYRLQEQYPATYPHQFQIDHKHQLTSSFDNLYYMRVPTSPPHDSAHQTTATSPTSKSCEPITAKNDENSSLATEVGSRQGSPIDTNETEIKMMVLTSNKGNTNGNACSSENLITKESYLNSYITIMDNCSKTFSKFAKIPCDTPNDLAYHCTMDSLMHAYNSHRNNSTNRQQVASY